MTLPCPQCGAEIRIQETSGFVRCPFCTTSLILELSGIRPHRLYRPRVPGRDLPAILRRFCDTHALPAPAPLGSRLTYYPFWRYPVAGGARLVEAWATIDARWRAVEAPDGEQSLYDPALLAGATAIDPSIEEPAARKQLAEPGAAPGELVHVPFYDLALRVGAARLDVSVEACSGRVYAHAVPAARPARLGVWLPAASFLLMVTAAALLPAWWLAAAAVLPPALVLYWMLAGMSRT